MYTGKGSLYPFEYNFTYGSLDLKGSPGSDYFSYKKHDIQVLFAGLTVGKAESKGWFFDKTYWPAEYQVSKYIPLTDRVAIELGSGNDKISLTGKAKSKIKNLDGTKKDAHIYVLDGQGDDVVTVASNFNARVSLSGPLSGMDTSKYQDKLVLKGKGWKLEKTATYGLDGDWSSSYLHFTGKGKTYLTVHDSYETIQYGKKTYSFEYLFKKGKLTFK